MSLALVKQPLARITRVATKAQLKVRRSKLKRDSTPPR